MTGCPVCGPLAWRAGKHADFCGPTSDYLNALDEARAEAARDRMHDVHRMQAERRAA